MELFEQFSSWRGRRRRKQDAEPVANQIVSRYRQGRARGAFRVDEQLLLDLQQVMPKAVAERMFGEFCTRRAHGHPTAEAILRQNIVIALIDAEHFATCAKPVNRPAEAEAATYPEATLRERAHAKVMAGQSLTDEEENAILWSRG